MTNNTLTAFNEAYRSLMVAKKIDEVKEIRDKAEALRIYVKQQGQGLEMQNACAEIKLRAERRAGELLKEMERGQGNNNQWSALSQAETKQSEYSAALDEANVSRATAYRWQTIAELPDEKFEEELATTKNNCEELTSSRILKIARRYVAKDKPSPPPLDGKYRIIYADPPWKYNDNGLDDYGHAERHYPTMSIEELCQLGEQVRKISENDAVLFLWATSPLLEDSFKVINAWGFNYKASYVWDKVKHNFGHYNSVRHEFLLICTRGSCTPDSNELVDSVQSISRDGVHSRKPDEFRTIIEAMYTAGNKIELFAREEQKGWKIWGNEPTTT